MSHFIPYIVLHAAIITAFPPTRMCTFTYRCQLEEKIKFRHIDPAC